MPSHWGNTRLNHRHRLVADRHRSWLQAVGAAEASLYYEEFPKALEQARQRPAGCVRSVIIATKSCTFPAARVPRAKANFSRRSTPRALKRLPVLFLIEDNGYAISVPSKCRLPAEAFRSWLRIFPHLHVEECDGTDPLESYAALSRAVGHCRAHEGPALVHAHVTRPYSHSLSDDEKLYKTAEEREDEAHRDPLPKFGLFLVREGILDEARTRSARSGSRARNSGGHRPRASRRSPPRLIRSIRRFTRRTWIPTGKQFETAARLTGQPKTMVEMISATLADEMARDERIVVFGEDVADCSREENLKTVKGKGGVFKATSGLQRQFGAGPRLQLASRGSQYRGTRHRHGHARPETRHRNSVFRLHLAGHDAVAQRTGHAALALAGHFKCPAIVRVAIGGYLTGGAIYHSQCGEVTFTHIPGLRVVMPSTALDVCGLLRTAIRSDDPVLFLEHKHLYRQPYNRSPYPGPDFTIPFGKARMVREGTDVSIITYGAVVHRAEVAAATLGREGVSVEIIDLRTLSPYDWDAIAATVQKTNRVIVAYEDMRSWGYGAEIAARIADELFDHLDAPVRRVAATDTFCAYHPKLEDVILPQTEDIERALRELLAY